MNVFTTLLYIYVYIYERTTGTVCAPLLTKSWLRTWAAQVGVSHLRALQKTDCLKSKKCTPLRSRQKPLFFTTCTTLEAQYPPSLNKMQLNKVTKDSGHDDWG